MACQRDRNDEGKVIFNQQSAENPMEQTSASTGERREFLEAFLQYNRAFHAPSFEWNIEI